MNMENALIRAIRLVSFFFMVACLLSPRPSFSQTHIELTPSISVGETYDDNIDLEADNEKSDYITTVSPGLELHVLSEKTDFGLRYAPTFVWYADYDDNNTTRHSGALTLLQDLSQNWRLELSDTYIQSEEPIEETEGITGVRRTRNTYQRNAAHVDFRYSFGPENVLNFGYRHSLLENDDVTLDDSTEQSPYASMTYWFNTYVTLDFSRDDNSIPGDDYTGHAPGIRYLRRFSPHSTGFAGYTYTTRNFDGVTENYDVHDGSVGLEHAFSPELSLTADLSYFIRKSEFSDDEEDIFFGTNKFLARYNRDSKEITKLHEYTANDVVKIFVAGNTILLNTTNEVFISFDYGTTWELVTNIQYMMPVLDKDNSNIIYMSDGNIFAIVDYSFGEKDVTIYQLAEKYYMPRDMIQNTERNNQFLLTNMQGGSCIINLP